MFFRANPKVAAERIIGDASFAKRPSRIVERATRWLLANDPRNGTIGKGVGILLTMNPRYAVPVAARFLNDSNALGPASQDLEYAISKVPQSDLFDRVARSTVQRGALWSSMLPRRHRRIFTQAPVVTAWIRRNMRNPRNKIYIADLLVEYLSHSEGVDATQTEQLIALARRLFDLYGSSPIEDVLRGWDLNPKPTANKPIDVALALAHHVAAPPRPVNVERLIQTYKKYPETWKALGGDALARTIRQGRLPPNYHYYNADLAAMRRGLRVRQARGTISERTFNVKSARITATLAARNRWEKRFTKLAAANVKMPPALLRQDRFAWSEVRLAALLTDHFTVRYEPANRPGFGNKRPDLWLLSVDGELYFEVQTINRRFDDLRTGARSSTGGDAKKRLQSKLKDKFHDGVPDFGLPIVIGLQADSMIDLDFDFENSIYGQLQSRIYFDKEKAQAVGDGTTRATENAFFNDPRSQCISAIAGVAVDDSDDTRVVGELYHPLPPTKHPLPAPLWVRLRTALFGPRPAHLVEAMARMPDVTRAEAEALVDHGVDEPSFFANGLIPRPSTLPIPEQRYAVLREKAARYQAVHETNEMRFLEAAQGVDLRPLYEVGIGLVDQLLRAKDAPAGFSSATWARLREEAAMYRPLRGGT